MKKVLKVINIFVIVFALLFTVGVVTKFFSPHELCKEYCKHQACTGQCHMPSCIWHRVKKDVKDYLK